MAKFETQAQRRQRKIKWGVWVLGALLMSFGYFYKTVLNKSAEKLLNNHEVVMAEIIELNHNQLKHNETDGKKAEKNFLYC